MTEHARNRQRDYALSLMKWIVVLPINGGTDWYDVAAFAYEADALDYCGQCNIDGRDPKHEVRPLGKEYRA